MSVKGSECQSSLSLTLWRRFGWLWSTRRTQVRRLVRRTIFHRLRGVAYRKALSVSVDLPLVGADILDGAATLGTHDERSAERCCKMEEMKDWRGVSDAK